MIFVTSFSSNYNTDNILKKANNLLNNPRDDHLKNVFHDSKTIRAQRQPKNLLRHLTKSTFISQISPRKCGLFKCTSNKCLICRNNWLQECDSFTVATGELWKIKCLITCNSINVCYYLVCLSCLKESYTGITINLRPRTNQHIHEGRTGNGSDKFDRHVFNCRRQRNFTDEPFFKLYVYRKFANAASLPPFEKHLHALGYDTMNRWHSKHSIYLCEKKVYINDLHTL